MKSICIRSLVTIGRACSEKPSCGGLSIRLLQAARYAQLPDLTLWTGTQSVVLTLVRFGAKVLLSGLAAWARAAAAISGS